MSVEKTLKKLQRMMRGPSHPVTNPGMTITVPEDLATDDFKTLVLDRSERAQLGQAEREVLTDLRFEYLDRNKAYRALTRFVCKAAKDRETDHVASFTSEHGRKLLDTRCYFPLLYLTILESYELAGVLFLPLSDSRIPAHDLLDTSPPCGGVVSAPVKGTNFKLMMERARDKAGHAIRILRVGMRKHNFLNDRQLRFELGNTYAFDDGYGGWQLRDDAAFDATLTSEMRELIEEQPLASLPQVHGNDMEGRAILALGWIDRARLASERVVSVLYLFFALEALVGDKSEKLKAYGLVFRRTILGHAVTGSFSSPSFLYYLYDEVRSAAVHGSEAPDISRDELVQFDYNVRLALNEYLTFARDRGLRRRSQVVEAVMRHEDARTALEWLRQHDPRRWEEYNPWGSRNNL